MPNLRLADGRPNVAAPPPRAAVRAGPTSSLHQLRELAERHPRAMTAVSAGGPTHPRAVCAGPSHPRVVRAGPPLPKRRLRRPVVFVIPTSSRRPRERRSRQRHGGSSGQRGPPDSGDPDPSRLGARVFERERGRATP
jgi:hypothetical protein